MLPDMGDGIDEEPDDGRWSHAGSVGLGLLLLLGLHTAGQGAMFFALLPFFAGEPYGELNALIPVFGVGLSQLVYVVPTIVILRTRRTERARAMEKGVWLGAAITFLLNAGCFGLLAVAG